MSPRRKPIVGKRKDLGAIRNLLRDEAKRAAQVKAEVKRWVTNGQVDDDDEEE